MHAKRRIYAEWAYIIGIVTLAFGTSLMEKANFGMSMVIAPAAVLFEKLSQTWSFVTLGMMNYSLEAVLLIALVVALRRFRPSFLLSFVTAFIYSMILDGFIALIAALPADGFVIRAVWYLLGQFFCAIGVAFLFHTYVPPEVYELIVKELSAKHGWDTGKVKTVYDIVSAAAALIMAFAFFGFGHFSGIGWGTIVCACINGPMIGIISKYLEKHCDFPARFRFAG